MHVKLETAGYVYILASALVGTLYIGVTSDLAKRIGQHKDKVYPGFTQKHGVHKLVYYEEFGSIVEAIAREKILKKWKRAWKIQLIEQSNPSWDDLFETLVR